MKDTVQPIIEGQKTVTPVSVCQRCGKRYTDGGTLIDVSGGTEANLCNACLKEVTKEGKDATSN